MKLNELYSLSQSWHPTPEMPLLFLGHGSPMNAIEENEFVQGFRGIAQKLPKPQAILCISAHWETKGTFVTAMEKPKTIHDFGGFPKALFDVQYPAPGSPALAKEVKEIMTPTLVGEDLDWGLDHGAWSVVKHLYPQADVPIIQMSLDYNATPDRHFELGKMLSSLRKKGILIIGSGNMIHNLRMVAWDKFQEKDYAYDWTREVSNQMKDYILNGNFESLVKYSANGKNWNMAIPTPEHYLPLLYILGLKGEKENITLFNDKAVAGSLTMTSVMIGG